jgi:hypothetical protein
MKEQDDASPRPVLEQVYLIERDTGLLCRILGMYAARGIDVRRADYAYAASDVMTLKVAAATETGNTAEALRILVAKAATLVGVIAAAEQPSAGLPHAGARRREGAQASRTVGMAVDADRLPRQVARGR